MKSAYNFLESRERSKNAVGERLGVRTEDHFPMQTRGNEELVPVLHQGRPSSYGANPPELDDAPFRPQSPRKGFFQMAFEGIKTNLLPGAILQVIALCIVLGYFYVDAIQSSFNEIAEVKTGHGYLFSAISTSLFGGFIPWLFMSIKFIVTERRKGEDGQDIRYGLILGQGLFYVLFFTEKGIEVDAFYRLQAYIFGDDNNVWTIVQKVLVDQFIYNPVWAAPSTMLPFMWKDLDFSFSRLREQLDWSFVTYRIPCALVSTWVVWVPTTSLVYTLPSPLQIPLFNLVLCFFVLLLSFVSQTASASDASTLSSYSQLDEEEDLPPQKA